MHLVPKRSSVVFGIERSNIFNQRIQTSVDCDNNKNV